MMSLDQVLGRRIWKGDLVVIGLECKTRRETEQALIKESVGI